MATLSDIKEKTGFSLATISRVLSNEPTLKVPEETRLAIISCANELGYKKKKSSRKKKIAILNWADREIELYDQIYFFMQIGCTNRVKYHKLQHVVIYRDDILNLIDVDGIVAIGKFSDRQLKLMSRYSNNIVFIDSNPNPYKYDAVLIDYKKIVEQSIEVMLKNKITNIGFIGGSEAIEDGTTYVDVQKKYFEDKMKKLNLYNPSIINYSRFGIETGRTTIKCWDEVEKVPQGIVCSSDAIAIGAISELISLGYKVPGQVKVIGCENYKISKYLHPSISTIDIPFREMGEIAVDLLVKRIDGDKSPAVSKFVETTMISRDSCKF